MSLRISKVYTKKGDAGSTRMIGGVEISKASPRLESYGTVDELQAVLGMLRAALREAEEAPGREIEEQLHEVQNDLFDLGSILSTPPEKADAAPATLSAERIGRLEETMDAWLEEQEPLSSFILSGGGRFSALGHFARTVCRRAERQVARLMEHEEVPPEVLGYLNRLSDWLFVLGRHLARLFEEDEPLWRTPLGGDRDGG